MDSENLENKISQDDSTDTVSEESSLPSTIINPIDTLFPKIDYSKPVSPPVIQITSIRSNPSKLRLRKNIEDILGENTTQFLDTLTDIMYDRIYLNKKPVTAYEEVVNYIEKRLQ